MRIASLHSDSNICYEIRRGCIAGQSRMMKVAASFFEDAIALEDESMVATERNISRMNTRRNCGSRIPALFLCATLVAFFLAVMPANSLAQTASTGALTGTVTDPSGSVVPGAQVSVTSESSGEVRTAITGGPGTFTISL